MVSMPYMFQKGPDWQYLEWYLSYNGDKKRVDRKLAMHQLLCGAAPGGTPDLTKGNLPSPPNPNLAAFNPASLLEHLGTDWFGENKGTDGKDIPHEYNGPISDGKGTEPARRGWWVNWYGTPSKIFSEALCRAIEVSLGLEHDKPPKKHPRRDWPIELLWICPVGWFQAGISWRKLGGGKFPLKPHRNGLVTLTWLTPGNTRSAQAAPGAAHGLFRDLTTPQRATAPYANPKMVLNPTKSTEARGHWIVGHTVTETVAHQTTNSTGTGNWPDVIPSTTSVNPDVTTVQPAWGDGGVDPSFP
jgi:hypothetical protein